MKNMYIVDVEGNILGSILTNNSFKETKDTKNMWIGYLLKPKWSFKLNKWVETATDEELNQEHETKLSDIQQLGQQVTNLEIEKYVLENKLKQYDERFIELEAKINV